MSFAREPRQLMISLMYLVLIAMLALNVSSEIIYAFYRLDETMERSNLILDDVQDNLVRDLEEIVSTREGYRPLLKAIKQIQIIGQEFDNYIDTLRQELDKEAGGLYTQQEAAHNPILDNKPKQYKNKDIPQRMFVTGDYGNRQELPKAVELDRKIKATKQQYFDLIRGLWDNGGIKATIFAVPERRDHALKQVLNAIALEGSEDYKPTQGDNRSWAESNFGHMPVAVVYPILRKFQNDGKLTEYNLTNFIAYQMSSHSSYETFDVYSASSKNYILLGEEYETQIALGAYSQSQKSSRIFINGMEYPEKNGRAVYHARPTRLGEHRYQVDYHVINPLTNNVDTILSKNFFFEVVLPQTVASADKMNVVYVGVQNPITIVKPKSYTEVYLEGEGSIGPNKEGKYIVEVKRTGKTKLVVANPSTGHKIPFLFHKKPIPQPKLQLGGYTKSDGEINGNVFKQQKRLLAILKDFDFDATCHVQSFNLYHIPKREDAIEYQNEGSSFAPKILHALQQAKTGDQYIFTNAKAICPGDKTGRYLNSLSFQIK